MEQIAFSDGLANEDVRARASAIIAMGKTGDKGAIKHLIQLLGNKSEFEWLRACAAIALGRLSDEEVTPHLINALGEDSIVLSRAAIVALGNIRSECAIAPLKLILEDQQKKELHALTVNTLSEIGGRQVSSTLLQALDNRSSQVRRNAALALGGLRIEEAVIPLIKLMDDDDECLRAIAASALGLIGDSRAIEPLVAALADEAETVRAIAASSLGYLGATRAITPLEKALHDDNETVRKQAGTALSRLRKKKDEPA